MQGESKALLAKAPSQRASTVPLVRQMSSFAENTNQANVNKHVEAVLTTVGANPADKFVSSIVYALVVLAVAVPFVVGPLLVYVKVDGIVTWSWWLVLLPLWIFNAFWLFSTCFSRGIAPADREDHFDDSVEVTNVEVHATSTTDAEVVEVDATVETKPENRIFNAFVVLMYILTEVFICLKLEGSITWHWAALMTPYYLVALMQGNCGAFANVGQVVLLATKLDGTLSWSWNAVFFPYWIGVVVGVVLAPLGVYAATKYSLAQASVDDEQPPSVIWPILAATLSFVLALAAFSPFLLLMYKLNWGELATVVVFIPYFVVISLVFVSLLVFGLASLFRSVEEDNVV